MSLDRGDRPAIVKRLVVALVVPAVVLVLAWAGHRATLSAAQATAPAVTSTPDAGAEAELDAPFDASTEAGFDALDAGSALEPLPDGAVIVNINLANETELRKLPGVGAVRAKAIVDLRGRLGHFKSVDDLVRIKGFGRTTVKRLRALTRI